MKETATTLRDLLASVVTPMGYEFVGCELRRQGKGSLLRVYIDKEGGVTLDDCSKISRQISAMLDVEDPIQGSYNLEVSSPGIERPLFEIAHFQKQLGKRVKVRMHAPIDNRRNFIGIVLKVDESTIYLLVDGKEQALPFSNIEKANVIADI